MAVGMVVSSPPSPSLSMPSSPSSSSLRRSPRIHPRHGLTSVAADVAAFSIQVRKRQPILVDATPSSSSSSVASSSSSLATPPTTPDVGARKRQRRPSQFPASSAETPSRCTSKHQLLTPRSIRATKRQRTSPSPSSMKLRRTTPADPAAGKGSARKGKKKTTPKSEATTAPPTPMSVKRKGKEKLTDWIPLELSPRTPATGGRRSRRSENSTPVVLGEPRPLGLGMATRSASRRREMGLAPPVSSASSPPSSPRLKPSLSMHLMSPLSPLSSAPPSPLSTPPTSPIGDDNMDVDTPIPRPTDVEMSTNNDVCMECEPPNTTLENTPSTPSSTAPPMSSERQTSPATIPSIQPTPPPQLRSRSSTSPPSRLQELKFDDTEIVPHAEPPRVIVLEEHVGQPEPCSNNVEMLYEDTGSDENTNIYRSDSNTTPASGSSVGYGFEMDASESMEGGSYYDDYSHNRDGGDPRGYNDGYDCSGYSSSCALQQPRIEKGDGVWKVACSWRVWEIQRRYTPDTIRAVVAQQANDYYATHGGLDAANTSVNGHRRKRSEEDNILGSAITRKDDSQCDNSVKGAAQNEARSQKELANGAVAGGKWGGNGSFGDDGLAYMLGYGFEDEDDEDSDDSDEDDDGECAQVESGDCSENELKWELVERDAQAVKTEEAGGGERKLIIQTLHLDAVRRDVPEAKPSALDSSVVSPSMDILPANMVQPQPDVVSPGDAVMSPPSFSSQSYPEPSTTIAIPQLPTPSPITTPPPKESELSFPSAPSPAQPSLSPSFTSFPSSPTALHLPFPPPRLSSIRVGLLRSMDIDDWGGEDEPLSSGASGERGAGRARRRPGWIGRGTPVDRRRRAEWANSWSPLSMKGKGRLGEEMDRMDGMPGALSIAMGMGPGMGVHASPPFEDPKGWNEFLRSLDMGNSPAMGAPRQDGMDIGLDTGVPQQLSMSFPPTPTVSPSPSFSTSPSPSPTLLSPTSVFPPANNPINGLNQNNLFVPPVPSSSPAPFQSALDLNFGRNGEGMNLVHGGVGMPADVSSMNGMNMGVNMGLGMGMGMFGMGLGVGMGIGMAVGASMGGMGVFNGGSGMNMGGGGGMGGMPFPGLGSGEQLPPQQQQQQQQQTQDNRTPDAVGEPTSTLTFALG